MGRGYLSYGGPTSMLSTLSSASPLPALLESPCLQKEEEGPDIHISLEQRFRSMVIGFP